MKKCNKCYEVLPYSMYGKHPETRDGYKTTCNPCYRDINNEYKQSKTGLPTRMYNNQKVNAKRRGQPKPDYSIKELRSWLLSQPLYHKLHKEWETSGYIRELVPSCDRDNDSLPYTLSNLTLMTWKENKAKGHKHVRENILHNPTLLHGGHRKVKRINPNTGEEKLFISLSEAVRNTPNVHQANISKVLAGQLKTTGGFKWQ